MVAICSLLREDSEENKRNCQGERFTLDHKSFHCFMYGRESTNAGAVASSSRVLTGLHSAPHSFKEHMVAAPPILALRRRGGWRAVVAALVLS